MIFANIDCRLAMACNSIFRSRDCKWLGLVVVLVQCEEADQEGWQQTQKTGQQDQTNRPRATHARPFSEINSFTSLTNVNMRLVPSLDNYRRNN